MPWLSQSGHYGVVISSPTRKASAGAIILYLEASSGFAFCRQEFGLSKASHGLDDAVLDLLLKHLTLLRLFLDVDMLSGKLRLFCVQLYADPLTCA